MLLSVIFLTLNEEFHIGEAIDNVKGWADEIFVVDSLSSDRTVEIALSKGARVVQRPFQNFGAQWNFALDHLPIRTQWTMKMDPDERLTEELKAEIVEQLKQTRDCSAFSYSLQLYFMGRPLHYELKNLVRIWRTGQCRFSDVEVNEHIQIKGKVGVLRASARHLDSANLTNWLDKQNRYTTAEALIKYRNADLAATPRLFGTQIERRMFLKKYYYAIPGRYPALFLYYFLVRGLWRSGRVGFYWIVMRLFVTYILELKWKEMKWAGRELTSNQPKPERQYNQAVLHSSLQQTICPESISFLRSEE